MTGPASKCCRDCGKTKPLVEYHRDHSQRLGRASYCKLCVAQRVRASREASPEMYARQKRDSARAQAARFAADPEPKRAYERARYAADPERWRDKGRACYRRNPEGYIRRARARAQSLVVLPGADEYAALLRGDPCSYCGGPGEEVDHIEPVAAGGEHSPDNLTSACLACNRSKSTAPMLTFLLAPRPLLAGAG